MTPAADEGSPDAALSSAIVRVAGTDGRVGGVGFLIAPDLVVTCARVVREALGLSPEGTGAPAGELALDRPLAGPGRAAAEVAHWAPPREDHTGDVAVLRLREPLPGAVPLAMADPGSLWGHPVRVLGLTPAFPDGVWHAGRLRGESAENRVRLSAADRRGGPVEPGFSGSPVWDEQAGAVVGMVVVAESSGARQSFAIPTESLVSEIPALAGALRPASPFRGLDTFREPDAGGYFGRDAEAGDIAGRLGRGDHPSVVLVGPSGCGKSSLALAGVAPRLRAEGYEVLVLRADGGTPPRTALAAELLRLAGPGPHGADRGSALRDLEEELTRHGLVGAARRALGDPAGRYLLVLDQAEQLLAGPPGPDDAEERAEAAAGLLFPDPHPDALRVLLTLRADFLEAALSHPLLGPALGRATVRPLLPMTREQLSEVILRPLAATPAVSYDPGLVHRMLDDAGAEPGALPRLGFVLERLWDEQAAGRIRFASYEALGGVGGALGRHAEEAWHACAGPADREEALRLLTGLVRVPPGGEAPLRTALTRAEAGETRWRIARALAERRILVLGGGPERGPTVELAHEALIGAWPALARQAAEHRESPGASPPRRGDDPARGRRLRRGAVAVLGALLVIAVVASSLLYLANADLDRELRGAVSARLAALAGRESSPARAALLAGAAYRTAPGPEARTALLEQYVRLRDVDGIVAESPAGDVRDTVMSEDGERLTVGLKTGEVLAVDLTAKPPRVTSPFKGRDTALVTASPDGSVIARASGDGPVTLEVPGPDGGWRTVPLRSADQARGNPGEDPREATALRFDGTGRRVLAVVPGDGVLVWETAGGGRVGAPLTAPVGWGVAQAWFGPDAASVIGQLTPEGSGPGAESRIVRWELPGGLLGAEPWDSGGTGAVTVSGDGSTLVRCTADGVLQAWDLTGPPEVKYRYDTARWGLCPLNLPRLDRTGRFLLGPAQRTGAPPGRHRLLVLDLWEGHAATLDLPGGASPSPLSLAGPPDALRVAAGSGGSVVVAHVPAPTAFDDAVLTSPIRTVDADHARIASVDADGGTLRLWDTRTKRPLAALRPSKPLARQYPVFSPDGTRILTSTADGRSVLVWDLRPPGGGPAAPAEAREIELPGPPGLDPGGTDPRTGLRPAWVGISFDGDGYAVLSGLSYVSRWRLSDGTPAGETYRPPAREPGGPATAAALTTGAARPGHRQAVVYAEGDELLVWDFGRGAPVARIPAGRGKVRQWAFDPTGRLLAVLTYGGRLSLYDMDRGAYTRTLADRGVERLAGFPSPTTLSTRDQASTLTLWDASKGSALQHFTPGSGATFAWSADGRRLAWVDGSRVTVLPMDPQAWQARLCALAARDLTPAERHLLPPGSRPSPCGAGRGRGQPVSRTATMPLKTPT
ncbi:trypsin-like peptidase domain-containing protein [Streptomyces goshikiensis]|uniref:nSTAND1 domain-containing NTPase n=1 Tax=Streptomyces goshikiensis TaxID=1942 RepID=UPI003685C5C6